MACLFLPFCFFKSDHKPTSRSKISAEVAASPRISSNASTREDLYKARESHDVTPILASLDNKHSKEDPPSIFIQHATQSKTEGSSIDHATNAREKKPQYELDPTLPAILSLEKDIDSTRRSEVFEDFDVSTRMQTHAQEDIDNSITSYSRKDRIKGANSDRKFYEETLSDEEVITSMEKTNSHTISQGRNRGSVLPQYMPSSRGSTDSVKRVATSEHTSVTMERRQSNNARTSAACVVVDEGIGAQRKKARYHSNKDFRSVSQDENVMEEEQSALIGDRERKHSIYEESATSGFKSRPTKKWDGNGIPNHTNKYKEDQKVCWHDMSFEQMLDQALAKQGKL